MLSIRNANIVVVGDTITDEFIHLTKMGESIEAVPTYKELSKKTYSGGAANVAKHCLQLGARVILIDNHPWHKLTYDDGFWSRGLPYNWPGNPFFHVQVYSAPIVKQRFIVDGQKSFKVNKLDLDWQRDLFQMRIDFKGVFESIVDDPEEYLPAPFKPDLVIAADNRHGMFSAASARSLVDTCLDRRLKLLVDSQMSQERPDWSMWDNCSELFVNQTEKEHLKYSDFANCAVHFKKGAAGSELLPLHGHPQYCSGFRVDAIDTLGAGDAYLAAWAVTEDIRIANAWAALACTKQGTELPSLEDLENILK